MTHARQLNRRFICEEIARGRRPKAHRRQASDRSPGVTVREETAENNVIFEANTMVTEVMSDVMFGMLKELQNDMIDGEVREWHDLTR